jgi:hypothetical protein
MREDKYDKLLNASIVLLIVSSIILAISSYKYFFKTTPVKKTELASKTAVKKLAERDSVQKLYNATINDIDTKLITDPQINSDKEAQKKLDDVSALRTEISALLKDQNNDANLASAKLKIEELQLKVAILQNRFTGVEAENKRLQALLNQLMSGNKNTSFASTYTAGEKPKTKLNNERYVANSNTTPATTTAAGLHLFAVVDNNNREQETDDAELAEKMVGTFSLKNISDKVSPEVMVVVLQPDGRVLKNSVWESGTFETKEGKKVYSRKIILESAQEDKQVNFSLTPDNFFKGEYTLQIWYNGKMIAKTVKTLS